MCQIVFKALERESVKKYEQNRQKKLALLEFKFQWEEIDNR